MNKMDTSNWTVDDHIEWMRHHAETLRIMDRLKLNCQIATMVHYDLPWLTEYRMSEYLDALAVQRALLEHGPNPVLTRYADTKEG